LTALGASSLRWSGTTALPSPKGDPLLKHAIEPATAVLILIGAWVANRLVRRAIRRMVASMTDDRGLAALRAPTALARTGEIPSLGPLIAGAGIVGVAVGFGSQNLVRDFISGIFMLMEDQYGVGDVVDAGPATGTVEGVGLRTTRLRDVNGTLWHIPNGEIRRVGNRSQGWARALVDVEVAYSTDLDDATRTIEQVAHDLAADPHWASKILEQPEVWGVEELGPDGIRVRLGAKTRPLEQWKVARELRARLKVAFDQAGIEVSAQKATTTGPATADDQNQPAA
jgi:Mechanosensitive ion channel